MSQRHDISIDQGADFAIEIDILDDNGDPDLTPYTANAMMRKSYLSSTSYSFECVVTGGAVLLSMSAAATANVAPGRYVYDVDLHDSESNTTFRIVEGQVSLTPGVTR